MDIVQYMRKGRVKAIIYVRGQDEGIQEMICKLYAEDKGYDVVETVKNIEDVCECDVLLVSHMSRITRDYIKYLCIANIMRNKGIEIEYALNTCSKKDGMKKLEFTEILKSL